MDLNLNIFKNRSRSKSRLKRFQTIASKDLPCYFCNNPNGQYQCSRCHHRYCSLNCFRSRKHIDCSEQFYKHLVLEQLKSTNAEDKEKFLKILARNHSLVDYMDVLSLTDDEKSMDNDKNDRINQFLERIMTIFESEEDDIDKIWTEKLTENDRNEFIDLVNSNLSYFEQFVEEWQPWWIQNEWQSIVINENDGQSYPTMKYLAHIEPLSRLTRKSPSPLLMNMILSLCLVYCYICRSYNGELNDYDSQENSLDVFNYVIIEKLFKLLPELKSSYNSNDKLMKMENFATTLDVLIERIMIDDNENENNNDDDNQMIDTTLTNLNEQKFKIIRLLDDLKLLIDWNPIGRCMIINNTDLKITHNNNDDDDATENVHSDKYQTSKAITLILNDLCRMIDLIMVNIENNNDNRSKDCKHQRKQLILLKKKLLFYLSFNIEYCHQYLNENQQNLFKNLIEIKQQCLCKEINHKDEEEKE